MVSFLAFSDCVNFHTVKQMTVVEAYICGKKIDPPGNSSLLPPKVTSLLIEGIAQNTTGSVFTFEVGEKDIIFFVQENLSSFRLHHLYNLL